MKVKCSIFCLQHCNNLLERLLSDLVRQTQENAILLRQALDELHELKQQVQSQRKIPFTVKTCGFEVCYSNKRQLINQGI